MYANTVAFYGEEAWIPVTKLQLAGCLAAWLALILYGLIMPYGALFGWYIHLIPN